MNERVVVAFDGSTESSSAALVALATDRRPGERAECRVLARRRAPNGKNQAKALLLMVDEMLSELAACPADLAAVTVGTGPGTFTGVRIAVATARALALALSIPVTGMSTLDVLANMRILEDNSRGVVVPLINAHRKQVFFAPYLATPDLVSGSRWCRAGSYAVCDAGQLDARLRAIILGCDLPQGKGENRRQCAGSLTVIGAAELGSFVPDDVSFQAMEVDAAFLVLGRPLISILGAGPEDAPPEAVTPIYVRSPDADLHISKMKDPWTGGVIRGPAG